MLFGSIFCGLIRRIRSGLIAIASCCPNGYASMLLYAILHLKGSVKAVNTKYRRLGEEAVSLEDIKRFRQLRSKCPGHPRYHP